MEACDRMLSESVSYCYAEQASESEGYIYAEHEEDLKYPLTVRMRTAGMCEWSERPRFSET